MATTINSIKVDFGRGAAPPRVTFLQGANMSVPSIRTTIRQIEQSFEAVDAAGAVLIQNDGRGWIARAGGNFAFDSQVSTALSLNIMEPFDLFFEAGPIPFTTSDGNLIGRFADSPGAIVNINNALAAAVTVLETGVSGLTATEATQLNELHRLRSLQATNPVVVDKVTGQITSGGITIDTVEDATTVTQTRS